MTKGLTKKLGEFTQNKTERYQIILKANGQRLDSKDYKPLISLVERSERLREEYQKSRA